MRKNEYNPLRIYKVFRLLLTFYLLIMRRESLFFVKPISPNEISKTINSLGSSFIKMAQVLATRSDFFPPAYLNELKKVHDSLPPMSESEFEKVYVGEDKIFAKFDKIPIASASIGQVHEAYLKDGLKVAVKLRRYGIVERVKADLKIINFFNYLFKPLFSHYTKNSLEAVISEFSSTILKEVSMTKELENLKKFSETYKNSNIIFPKFYEVISNDDMLVMSFEEGFRFDDRENIEKFSIDIRKVIKDLVLFYVEQMLIRGYFHADPHPGNVFINKNSQLILLDFGMVKSVPNQTRLNIIALLKAANEQNYEKYIVACKNLGISAYETPTAMLAEFVEQIFAIFANDSLKKSTMQDLAFEVMESTAKFPFKLPAEAIYILRVSAIIEGLGTTYIENFNGVKDILPILVENLPRAIGAKDTLVDAIFDELEELPENLHHIKNSFYKISTGEIETNISKLQLSYFEKAINEKINSIIFPSVLVLISFFLLLVSEENSIISTVLFIIGIIKLIYRK